MRIPQRVLPVLSAIAISTITFAGPTANASAAPPTGIGITLKAPVVATAATPDGGGYWLVTGDGGVFAYGNAPFLGSATTINPASPVVGMAASPDGGGYWLVATDGGVFSFGDAQYYGSAGGQPLASPIVSMAATPDGHGYWLVARDGGVFSFGDARYYGSAGGQPLASPIVGMAPTPDGHGYWLVAGDGGVFAYGDATFDGSMVGQSVNGSIVGIVAADGGYQLVGSDGAVFAFGGAPFYGAGVGQTNNQWIIGMAPKAGGGYWLVAFDGSVFTYGNAGFFGSLGGALLSIVLPAPVVVGDGVTPAEPRRMGAGRGVRRGRELAGQRSDVQRWARDHQGQLGRLRGNPVCPGGGPGHRGPANHRGHEDLAEPARPERLHRLVVSRCLGGPVVRSSRYRGRRGALRWRGRFRAPG